MIALRRDLILRVAATHHWHYAQMVAGTPSGSRSPMRSRVRKTGMSPLVGVIPAPSSAGPSQSLTRAGMLALSNPFPIRGAGPLRKLLERDHGVRAASKREFPG